MTSILILQHQRPDGEVDTYHLKAGRRYHLGRGSQCQIRVLDLKLSRQHCAFEYADQGWLLVDLASTNGCSIDGERVNGNRPLRVGSVVAAGSTSVQVLRFADSAEDPAAADQAWPEQGETEPPRASDRLAAIAERSSANDDHELQPAPSRATISDPLIPSTPPEQKKPAVPLVVAAEPTPPAPATPAAPSSPDPLDHDVLATLPPGRQAAPEPTPAETPSDAGSRTFYINVLGRRVGPLNKAQARELKTKEIKGSLTPADLAAVEAEASLGPVTPPSSDAAAATATGTGDEQRTYYVTLLGQRVGPLSRGQARELKAKELRGILTQDELDRLIVR